jgi:uncharacterized membrane protein
MVIHTEYCNLTGCKGRCVQPAAAGIIVTIVASVILAHPWLMASGLTENSGVFTPFTITYQVLIYTAVWLLVIIVGCTKKHENIIWCLLDSAGIPAIAALLLGVAGIAR